MGQIKSNLKQLLLLKSVARGEHISLRTASSEREVSIGTLQRWSAEFPDHNFMQTLAKICDYLEVESINDLLVYIPDTPTGADADQAPGHVTPPGLLKYTPGQGDD